MENNKLGRYCEDLVKAEILKRSKCDVINLNDKKNNFPIVDLKVINRRNGETYDVSVKSQQKDRWPSVKGIHKENQYIVFVEYIENKKQNFFILNYSEWISTLKKIKPQREKGTKIVKGALEWNWEVDGVLKKRRGSWLFPEDIKEYKSCWETLPYCK